MRLFTRTKRPLPPPSLELRGGETVERAAQATLLHGKRQVAGTLYLTDRRLIFEAKKGDARWLIVPFDEVRDAGMYRPMHAPARGRHLFIETTKGEQVWWWFGEKEEEAWLPLVRARAEAARASARAEEDG